MKCLLVVLIAVLALVAADDEWKPPSETPAAIEEQCIQESGITKEQQAKMGKSEGLAEKEIYDYVLCNTKKFGVFTEDGGYNVDHLITLFSLFKIDEEKAREVLNKCVDSNEQKSTPGEWAYRGMECMKKNKIDELFREGQERMKNSI